MQTPKSESDLKKKLCVDVCAVRGQCVDVDGLVHATACAQSEDNVWAWNLGTELRSSSEASTFTHWALTGWTKGLRIR